MPRNKTISKILKMKDSRKKELELDVKKAHDRADKEKSKLHSIEQDYKDTVQCFNEKSGDSAMNVNKINSYYDYFARIQGKIDEQKKVHDQRESELEALKNNLVDAHKEKRAFEILNEKEIRKDLKEKLDSEQKEADFLALYRRIK